MSLPRDVYWSIEDDEGNLARGLGAWGHNALLFPRRYIAKEECRNDERPVKVRIVKED